MISRNRKILQSFTEKDWQHELEKFRQESSKKEYEAKLLKEADKDFFKPDAFTILFSLFGIICLLLAPKSWISDLIIYMYSGFIVILVGLSGSFGFAIMLGAILFAFPVFVASGWLIDNFEELARFFIGLVPGYLSGAALDHFLRVRRLKSSKKFRIKYAYHPLRAEQILVFLETRLIRNLGSAKASMQSNLNEVTTLLNEARDSIDDIDLKGKTANEQKLLLASKVPLLELLQEESHFCLEMLDSLIEEIQKKIQIMNQIIHSIDEERENTYQSKLAHEVEMFENQSDASVWLDRKFTEKNKLKQIEKELDKMRSSGFGVKLDSLFVEPL